jgi:8-oxo-dGTP diphosphatase
VTDFSQYSDRIRVRAAALIIENDSILLVKQLVPVRKEPVWLPPGGGLETGERTESALIREVEEETGLLVRPSHLRYVHEFIHPPFHSVELYFVAGVGGGELKKGSDPEHSDGRQLISDVSWHRLDDAMELELFPVFLRAELKSGTILRHEISHFTSA